MKNAALILLIAVLLFSCSSNKKHPHSEPTVLPDIPFDAPGWLWNIPSGSYAIGFGYSDTFFSSRADSLAREFAAVSLSRNHSAFVVDKQTIISLAQKSDVAVKNMDFKVVVSSDMEYLHRASKGLKLLDKYDAMGYMIGLYGFIDGQVDSARRPMLASEKPDWCEGKDLYERGNTIYSVALGSAARLSDAWYLAQEKALRQIGQHKILNVLGLLRATNDSVQRDLALETVTRNQKTYFDKCFIIPVQSGNSTSFRVYLQLKTSKNQ